MWHHKAMLCSLNHSLLCQGTGEEKGNSSTLCFNFCCLLVLNILNQCKGILSSVKGRFYSTGAKLCITEASTNAESSSEIMLVNEAEPDSASSSSFKLKVIPWSAHWSPTVTLECQEQGQRSAALLMLCFKNNPSSILSKCAFILSQTPCLHLLTAGFLLDQLC